MASNPSLAELRGYAGDAELGLGEGGATAVKIAPDYSTQYLLEASKAKADADKYVYQEFQKNLANTMQNFNSMDVKDMMQADYKPINEKRKQLMKMLVDNFDVIRNPNRNIEKYSQIKQLEAEVRGDIDQSKMEKLVDDEHEKFIAAHPTYNTASNKAKIDQFRTKPLGQRELFSLDNPFTFDPQAMAAAAAKVAEAKTSESTSDGKYITDVDKVSYKSKAFDEAVKGTLASTDAFGESVRNSVAPIYDSLPVTEKQKYPTLEDWFVSTINKFKPQDQVTKNDLRPDQYGLIKQEFANNKSLNDIRFRQDLTKMAKGFEYDKALAKMKDEFKIQTATEKGDFINSEAAKIISSGLNSKEFLNIPLLGIKEHAVNISPKYLSLFGYELPLREDGDTAGKKIFIKPDATSVDEKGNFRTIFYDRDEMGNILIEKNGKNKGKPRVDPTRSIAYTPDQLRGTLATIVSDSNIDDVLMAGNKSLFRSIGSESLDGGNVAKYVQAKGLSGHNATEKPADDSTLKSITISKQRSASGTYRINFNGKDFDLPADQLEQFKKDYPDHKEE